MKLKLNTISPITLAAGLFLLISGLAVNTYAEKSEVNYSFLSLKAEDLNAKRNYQGAIDLLLPHAKDKNNKNPFFFNELGTAYFFKQDNLNANKYFAIAHQLDKKSAKIIYNLASSFALLNNYDEALRLFKLAEAKGFDKKLIKEWIDWIKKKQLDS